MLLGLVLHAGMPYHPGMAGFWPSDPKSSRVIQIIFDFIHIWRMPLFFILSGFFANLMVTRKSWKAWWWNRLLRIGLPMVIFLPLMSLTIPWIFKYGFSGEFDFFYSLRSPLFPYHLWFLWHLIIFALFTILLRGASLLSAKMLNFALQVQLGFVQRGSARIKSLFVQMFFRPKIPIGFISLCLFVNIPSWGELIYNPLASGLYFVFGYALYGNSSLLSSMISHWSTYLIIALLMFIVHAVLVIADSWVGRDEADLEGLSELVKYTIKVSCATIFSFGFIGLAESRFREFNKTFRFISDGSYWMYLVHLPIVALISFSMFDWQIPVIVKYLFAIGLTSVISLTTYKYFVRNTAIGLLLNGRRYPFKAEEGA